MVTEQLSTPSGCFFGIGVGPGDPELLTLKALRVLQAVPVICVPQAKNQKDSYALSIIKQFLEPQKQEILGLAFPTDDPEGAAGVWQEAAQLVGERLQRGQDVAFITEGDPMLYSTFSYVLDSIRTSYPDSKA